MIESTVGVANLGEIVATPGFTGVLVGQMDLAASMGHLDESDHPDVGAAIEKVFRTCIGADIPCGMYAPDAAAAARLESLGAAFVTIGSDVQFAEAGLRAALSRHGRG